MGLHQMAVGLAHPPSGKGWVTIRLYPGRVVTVSTHA